jgi:segregation and condensation protein A
MSELNDNKPLHPVAGESEPEGGSYRVQVGQFEGPLDLLLHLVRVNEIDVADIPIVEVTAQYNEHLEVMRDLNLEIAGEYLVMAATLMQIKSRMLLPPDPTLGEEEEADDPRAALAQQLLEYQRFKQAAETLQAMDSRRSLIWSRDSIPDEYEGEELLTADLFDLLKSFRELLGRLGEDTRLEIMRDTVSIAEKISWLTDLLEARSSVELLALLEDLPSKLERIATFLAVLEMIRLRLAVAFQRKLFGEIRLTACADGNDEDQPRREEQ